jgi:hypothetical protein
MFYITIAERSPMGGGDNGARSFPPPCLLMYSPLPNVNKPKALVAREGCH